MDRYQKEFRADGLERFTLYWRDGSRNVVKGKSIEDAFTQAGYGGGAISALDWYDTGVTETHWYNREKHEWVKYEPIHIHHDDVMNNVVSHEEIQNLLEKHGTIIVDLEDKSRFVLTKNIGNFAIIGWTQYIELVFGEYNEGSYIDDPDEDGYFMACASEYFSPNEPEKAVEAFFKRITNPAKSLGMGSSLEEIKHTQMDL